MKTLFKSQDRKSRFNLGTTVIAVFFLALVFPLSGCGKGEGEDIPTAPAPTVKSLVQDGWTMFEAADYDSAAALFRLATKRDAGSAEAYLGLAWSLAHTGGYGDAILAAKLTIILAGDSDLSLDARAALTVIYSVSGKDSLAVVRAAELLTASPEYQFQHDSRVSASSLKLILAQCNFKLREYYRSHQWVEQLNPGFTASLSTQEDTTEVLTVSDVVSGYPVAVDSVGSGEHTNNLVSVLGASTADGEGSFSVVSVTKRWTDIDPREARTRMGWEVTIKFASDPLLTIGTKVKVRYLYALDYSRYLAQLMAAIQSHSGEDQR